MTQDLVRFAQADLLLLLADLWRAPESTVDPFENLPEAELPLLVAASQLSPADTLVHQWKQALRAWRESPQAERESVYRSLFDGRIGCPINEATFIRRDKGAILGDLCGFYRAFGWKHSLRGERPDHLLVELEFVAALLVMAARSESEDQRETTIDALAEFTRHHPNDWVVPFCQQIRLTTTHRYFVAASELLENTWNALIQFHGWTVDSLPAPTVGLGDEPEEPYECGAPDLISIASPKSTST